MRLLNSLRRFICDEAAATATEYAVMLALILAVILISVGAAGNGVGSWWSNIDSDLSAHGF